MATILHVPLPREHVLSSGSTTIGVIPALNLVSHFQVDSWQVHYRPIETGNVERWGLPLMIPIRTNLSKDGIFKEKGTTLPIHGFGRSLPWTVIEQDSSRMSMQLTSNSATRRNYPYDFTFTATIVAGEEALTYSLLMENQSDELMPIAPGFHAYFAVAQRDKAKLVVVGLPGFQVDAFDWATDPSDNPYPFPHHVTLQFPGLGTLVITELPCDAHFSLANMQVWTEPASAPDHEFVCFEPTVSSEDAPNRPADRLNIAPSSSRQIVLQLRATPLRGEHEGERGEECTITS
jgi:galactose mutarotase-like enzyme